MEINLLDLPNDMLCEIEGHTSFSVVRILAQVSRAFNTRVTERLKAFRYFLVSSHFVGVMPTGESIVASYNNSSWTQTGDWPHKDKLHKSLMALFGHPNDMAKNLVISSVQEIDLTSVGSRTWWYNRSDSPPLLPLEIVLHYRKPGASRFPRTRKRTRSDAEQTRPKKKLRLAAVRNNNNKHS